MTHYLFELIQGLLIGAGAILPGISGASLAVVFGVYEDFTNLLAHPRKTGKDFFHRHASLCIGIVVGFVSFSLLLNVLFDNFSLVIVYLFIGFIAGTVPGIFKRASAKGIGPAELASFGISFALMLLLFFATPAASSGISGASGSIHAAPHIPGQWLLAGGAIGAGSLLPGVSASFILIFFNLYGALLEAVKNLDIPILIQLGAGALASLALLSHLVSWLYRHFHGVMSFAVLGFTLGSLVLVFPGIPVTGYLIPCAIAAIAGLILSLALEKQQA